MKKDLSSDLTFYFNDIFRARPVKFLAQKEIIIGVGANVGDVKRRFEILISQLKQNNKIKLKAVSPLLKNPPFGFLDQNDFLNFIIVIHTNLSPVELFEFLKKVENRFGRTRDFKNAPRTLDLDIIFFRNKKIKTEKLCIPHKFWQDRQSVVLPLNFVAMPEKAFLNLQKKPNSKPKKVLVGLSGGIDSSVSAKLLQDEGYEVEGVYMKLHNSSQEYHKQNLEAVAKVANFLGIKYHILDLQEEFKKEVFDYFVQSYKDATTPNPCVKCNKSIKFGALFEFAKKLGVDFLATGHYAATDGFFIYEAQDSSKDQSYFLAQIDKNVLPKLLFPMSSHSKEEIKKMALKMPAFKEIAQKKESQEICFVPNVYTDILKEFFDIDKVGAVVDENGKKIGEHKGYMHYTIGKRRGFSVNGAHDPHFVTKIDSVSNILVVGKKEDLGISEVWIDNLNMFVDFKEFECSVKLRYRSVASKCFVKISQNSAKIELYEKAYGVAVGQVAVFYDGSKILGSGFITNTKK